MQGVYIVFFERNIILLHLHWQGENKKAWWAEESGKVSSKKEKLHCPILISFACKK